MVRRSSDKLKAKIIGARMKEDYETWKQRRKAEGKPASADALGQMLNPPASRGSIENYFKGQIPNPERLKQLCVELGVPEDRYDIDTATHDESYEFDSDTISKIIGSHVDFAVENNLDLDLIRSLSSVMDFDKDFPLYSPIGHWTLDPDTGKKIYDRKVEHKNSAPPRESDFDFLQIKRDGKNITLHRCDLAFLKEVQDQVVDFVEFLFYKRSKEMVEEVQSFNDDLYVTTKNPDGSMTIEHKAVTEEYILSHDRFAKYFEHIFQKATQDDWNRLFESIGSPKMTEADLDRMKRGDVVLKEISEEDFEKITNLKEGETFTIKKDGE